jgi:flavodoxin
MKTLVAYYSETGNTAKIAGAIREGLSTTGHEADLISIADAAHPDEIAPDTLNAYDLLLKRTGIGVPEDGELLA